MGPRPDSLLYKLKKRYRKPVTLTGRSYRVARRMLLDTAKTLNDAGITYFLDAGALLGLVRDGDLIPWDDDLDIRLPASELERFRKVKFRLRLLGWRVSEDSRMPADGPAWKKGDLRSIKIRNRNALFFGRGRIVMDVLIVYPGEAFHWHGAMGQIWKFPARFFKSTGTVSYGGVDIQTPAPVHEYLEYHYGDWKTPLKDYDPMVVDGGYCCGLGDWRGE